jgi:hypothetical protein
MFPIRLYGVALWHMPKLRFKQYRNSGKREKLVMRKTHTSATAADCKWTLDVEHGVMSSLLNFTMLRYQMALVVESG